MRNNQGDRGEIAAEILDTYRKFEDSIRREFFPELGEEERGELTPSRLDYGGPRSSLYKLTYSTEDGEEYNLMCRFYGEAPETYQGKEEPRKKDKATYNFLKESGIENVPKAYLPNSSRVLFLEWKEGDSLLEKVKEVSRKERAIKVGEVLDSVADFQYKATQNAIGLSDYMREKLFSARSLRKKAEEYLSRNREEVDDNLVKAYTELVGPVVEGQEVIHGDLGPENIILNEGIELIDPELELGEGIVDPATLLSYMGMHYDMKEEWDIMAESFETSKLEKMVRQSGGHIGEMRPRESLAWLVNGLTKILSRREDNKGVNSIKLSRDKIKEVMYNLYVGIFHKSYKILSKNKVSGLYGEEEEERLKEQIDYVLGELVARPEKFGITYRQKEAAKFLMSLSTSSLDVGIDEDSDSVNLSHSKITNQQQ